MQLARLAADSDKERSLKLVEEAASKGNNNPEILLNAAMLAYRLGQDNAAMPWMAEAARLSTSEDGPVRMGNYREVIQNISAGADRTMGVVEAFSTARIPIHLAASSWNAPITNILVTRGLENRDESDPRRRTIIPVRHGKRGLVDISQINTVAADYTSLLLMAEFEILPQLSKRFSSISIPWSMMELLLTEYQSCRFHQPSRIENAKLIRDLIAEGIFIPLVEYIDPPPALVKEVGRNLADLIIAASKNKGRVVRSLPIYKLQTFMEVEADIGEFNPIILTTRQFIDVLESDAVLDRAATSKAQQLLTSIDVGEALGPNEIGDAQLFLDGLAISHLTSADILGHLRRTKKKFVIHQDTANEAAQVVSSERHTNNSLEVLLKLRDWLHAGITSGYVRVMPRSNSDELRSGVGGKVIQEIFANIGGAEAVIIDDRSMGFHEQVTDKSGRHVPLLDIFDILQELVRLDQIKTSEYWQKLHNMRQQGFICVPLELGELFNYLSETEVDAVTGQLKETSELRAIRENFQHFRSTKILQQPAETIYLDRLRIVGLQLIRQMWIDVSAPLPETVARSEWLWKYMVPSPVDWAHSITEPTAVVAPEIGLANQISLLLTIGISDGVRRRTFQEWVQSFIMEPLEIASPKILAAVTDNIKKQIPGWVDDGTK